MPFTYEDAEGLRNVVQPTDERTHLVDFAFLIVRSVYRNFLVPLVLQALIVLFDGYPIQLTIGLEPTNDLPLLFATPFDELGRGIPAIEKDIDLVVFGQEWCNGFEHFFGYGHLAAKAQFLAASPFTIEFANSSTSQVKLNINREADVANGQAHQDIDRAFAVDRLLWT